MKKLPIICSILFFSLSVAYAQPDEKMEEVEIDGQIVKALIVEGDTILIADLKDVDIVSQQNFKDNKERYRFNQMQFYAKKVYPYAVEAIKLFREVEKMTVDMNKRESKKYIKTLQKDYKENFEKPLKDLNRSQGKILLKMIEREIGVPTYTLIKELRGGGKAFYWNSVGKLYGYQLKEGYDPEDDPMLEAVLSGFDIKHDL